jgi:uncharacterized membrane protein
MVDKQERTRRTGVVLRVMGWVMLGIPTLLVLAAASLGKMASLGDGVLVLPIVGGVLLGASYILGGFSQAKGK